MLIEEKTNRGTGKGIATISSSKAEGGSSNSSSSSGSDVSEWHNWRRSSATIGKPKTTSFLFFRLDLLVR